MRKPVSASFVSAFCRADTPQKLVSTLKKHLSCNAMQMQIDKLPFLSCLRSWLINAQEVCRVCISQSSHCSLTTDLNLRQTDGFWLVITSLKFCSFVSRLHRHDAADHDDNFIVSCLDTQDTNWDIIYLSFNGDVFSNVNLFLHS